MSETVDATYEGGVLRPAEPLRSVQDRQRVRVTVVEVTPGGTVSECVGTIPDEDARQMREAVADVVAERVAEIDAAIPRAGAAFMIDPSGAEEPITLHLRGNRAGYLRFGIELMKAALAPTDASNQLPAETLHGLNAAFPPASEISIEVEQAERIEPSPKHWQGPPLPATVGQKLYALGCLVAIVAAFIVFCVGIAATIRWMTRT